MGNMASKLVFKNKYEIIPNPPTSFFGIKMKDINGEEFSFAEL